MRIPSWGGPSDTSALWAALSRGTAEDLDAVYKPRWVNRSVFEHSTLLELALSNNAHRVPLAHRLLDDGARATDGRPLHRMLGANAHDFPAEAVLLGRLLDAGADINAVMAKFGTPLETLSAKFKFSDRDLAPFYDVLLAHPDLDLTQVSSHGRTVIANLRKQAPARPDLIARCEQRLLGAPGR